MRAGASDLNALFRRMMRNVWLLLGGTAAVTILGLGTLALITRALTPAEIGIIALLEALVAMLGLVFSFDTPQAVIKFGGARLERDDVQRFRAVAGLALLLDFATGLAAGVVGLALVFGASAAIGVPDDLRLAACAFAATLFLSFPGTPLGILRTLDRFGPISATMVAQAALRLAVAAWLFAAGAPLEAYVYGFAAVLLLANLARLGAALLALKRAAGTLRLPPVGAMRAEAPAFLRFSAGAWMTATLRVVRQQGLIFIVAAFLGAAGAGVLAVAQRLVAPIAALSEPLRHSVFPELARLSAAGRHADVHRLVGRTFRMTGPLGLLVAAVSFVFGGLAIRIVAGEAYLGAYWPLVAFAAARSLQLATPFLNPLAILYGGMRNFTLATAVATLLWAVLSPLAILVVGIHGAGLGQVAFALVLALASLSLFRRYYDRALSAR